uniref:Uncharacterized protein n=1 Tax=Ixodes ricinus TaxID=34613 RepID=A0A6B0V8W4_IXORI
MSMRRRSTAFRASLWSWCSCSSSMMRAEASSRCSSSWLWRSSRRTAARPPVPPLEPPPTEPREARSTPPSAWLMPFSRCRHSDRCRSSFSSRACSRPSSYSSSSTRLRSSSFFVCSESDWSWCSENLRESRWFFSCRDVTRACRFLFSVCSSTLAWRTDSSRSGGGPSTTSPSGFGRPPCRARMTLWLRWTRRSKACSTLATARVDTCTRWASFSSSSSRSQCSSMPRKEVVASASLRTSASSEVSESKRSSRMRRSSFSWFQYLLTTVRTPSSEVWRFSSCSTLALSSFSCRMRCSNRWASLRF